MNNLSTEVLFWILVALIFASGFFSGSETGLMSINRYRLRHRANKEQHKGAIRVLKLLERPDRLIGVILIGNNLVNNFATVVATLLAIKLYGEGAVFAAAILLTIVVLIFSELTPKTLAAMHPEKIAYPASFLLAPLLYIFYPINFIINGVANSILRILGVRQQSLVNTEHLTTDELRTVINESGNLIPRRHLEMMTSILDLEHVTVDDVMVTRSDILGLDISEPIDKIVSNIAKASHSRLVVYDDMIDNVLGILHLRDVLPPISKSAFNVEDIKSALRDVYYIPEGTPLNVQLIKFQRKNARIGLVVDEYGDIQGLVTLEDIMGEIIEQFGGEPPQIEKEIFPQKDGTFLVDGTLNIRDLNRVMKWHLPIRGPKTLNGLIVEHLESFPQMGYKLTLEGYLIEVMDADENIVKQVKITPKRLFGTA